MIEVEDDGPGVPPELWDRVFEPFYTTKGEGRGTGLGLALARGIVEDHGGTIAFVQPSGPEWSTRVRIELPRLPEPRFMDDHIEVEEAAHV
jgi:signal transduction histidine kinase